MDAETAQRAAAWIRSRTSERPWLAVVSIINPHDILHPNTYTDITTRDVELPDNFSDTALSSDCPEIKGYAEAIQRLVPTDEVAGAQYLQAYST
jgi:hypothetical protein